MPRKEIDKKIDSLIDSIDRVYPSMGQMIWRSFVHGLFVALGATIGLALIVSLVTYVLTNASFIPKDYKTDIEKILPNR